MAIRPRSDRTTDLTFEVFAGQSSVLEASIDLADWTRLGAFETNGTMTVTDRDVHPRRFYRIRTE